MEVLPPSYEGRRTSCPPCSAETLERRQSFSQHASPQPPQRTGKLRLLLTLSLPPRPGLLLVLVPNASCTYQLQGNRQLEARRGPVWRPRNRTTRCRERKPDVRAAGPPRSATETSTSVASARSAARRVARPPSSATAPSSTRRSVAWAVRSNALI